jgi:hypothetical protein
LRIRARETSPPVDGEANAAVIELLAKTLGVAKSAVEVVAGATSRRKTIKVRGISRAAIEELAQ